MKLHRDIGQPIRKHGPWQQRWASDDGGIVACWERGREKAREAPDLAALARSGQLVELPWKGGVQKALKKKEKYGSYFYLAMWQGLRGDDLDIDTDSDFSLTCSATCMRVVYTSDRTKYAED